MSGFGASLGFVRLSSEGTGQGMTERKRNEFFYETNLNGTAGRSGRFARERS